MALFIPVLIGVPIGYYTWATVFDAVDDKISQAISGSPSHSTTTDETQLVKKPNSPVAATVGTVASIGILGKYAFTPRTRHRLFFAKAPANSNIRVETLKLGIELLLRSGIVFYGGAIGGATAGRITQAFKKE